MQARMSPARIESILTSVKRVREGLSLTVKQLNKCWVWCQLRPTWYLLACCKWDPYSGGSRPRGSPQGETHFAWSRSRASLRALDMWRKPWFLSQGLVLGVPCRHIMLATDASLTSWGAVTVCGVVAISRGTSTAWRCWPCYEQSNTFYQTWEITMCWCKHPQHSGGLLYQLPGVCVCAPCTSWLEKPRKTPRWEQFIWIWEQTSCRGRRWGQGNGCFTLRWWSRCGEFWARLRWICLQLVRHCTFPSGYLWLIQLRVYYLRRNLPRNWVVGCQVEVKNGLKCV